MNKNMFENKNYLEYLKSKAPKTKHFKNLIFAFLVGGFICVVGESFRELLMLFGIKGDEMLGNLVSSIMIFLGAILTGFGVYDKIGNFAGCGSIVPITGFANSIVSPALESKTEGVVLGIESKMFTIAGPVIVSGIVASALVGIIYYIIYLF